MFSIEISSWWFFPVTNMKCSSLSLLIDFSLKCILLDIRIATPACFLVPFDWNFFSQPFTLSLRFRCVSCMQQKDGFCFSYPVCFSLCLFIGEFSPFILRDINDQWLLVPISFVFVVGDGIVCVCVSLLLDLLMWDYLLPVVFVGVANPWVGVFLLVLSVGLDLWVDTD